MIKSRNHYKTKFEQLKAHIEAGEKVHEMERNRFQTRIRNLEAQLKVECAAADKLRGEARIHDAAVVDLKDEHDIAIAHLRDQFYADLSQRSATIVQLTAEVARLTDLAEAAQPDVAEEHVQDMAAIVAAREEERDELQREQHRLNTALALVTGQRDAALVELDVLRA